MAEKNLQVHSNEMQDIITKPPAWIMRWGITLCIVILLMLGALSYMIHYPDLLKTRMVVYANGSSKPIIANTNGLLVKLVVKNEQHVKKGQPLAFIDAQGQENIIAAPQDGQVNFIGLLNEGQTVHTGQSLFYVSNKQSGFYGEIGVSQYDISKVKPGQKVLIKLAGYRYEDFGIIHGIIDTIAKLPYNDSVYVSRVKFNPAYNHNIILKNGLSAEGDIVIKDISLADRLIGSLKKSVSFQQ